VPAERKEKERSRKNYTIPSLSLSLSLSLCERRAARREDFHPLEQQRKVGAIVCGVVGKTK